LVTYVPTEVGEFKLNVFTTDHQIIGAPEKITVNSLPVDVTKTEVLHFNQDAVVDKEEKFQLKLHSNALP
jgi:hypothetical protein